MKVYSNGSRKSCVSDAPMTYLCSPSLSLEPNNLNNYLIARTMFSRVHFMNVNDKFNSSLVHIFKSSFKDLYVVIVLM